MRFLSKNPAKIPLSEANVEELLSEIQQGHPDALEAMYDRYAGRVYAFLLRAVERELAEELLQDIFLALWQKVYQYDPSRGSFNAWFFTLVRRRVYDALRSKHNQHRASLLSQLETGWEELTLTDAKPDLEEHVLKLFRDEEIRQALNTLPNEQREIILMTYFGGYSQREVAEQLNLPVSTIKGRARLGLQRLRQLIPE